MVTAPVLEQSEPTAASAIAAAPEQAPIMTLSSYGGKLKMGVVREEYAVSTDGMKMFGVMDLTSGFQGCRFVIGLHDKSFRLSCTVGLRVYVCENLAFHGEYTPVLAKHSKNFLLEDCLAVGVDRMQRNFGPLNQQVDNGNRRNCLKLRQNCSSTKPSSKTQRIPEAFGKASTRPVFPTDS